MSCSWDVYCTRCKQGAGLDGNHAVEFMRDVIIHAKEIAALSKLFTLVGDAQIQTSYGILHPAWFADHKDHELVARNEYGHLDNECNEQAQCAHCGAWHPCVLGKDHDLRVPHSFKK